MNGTIKGASQGTMPNEQDDGSTITTTANPKMRDKSVNYANVKTSIISFMKGEIKFLLPELLKLLQLNV